MSIDDKSRRGEDYFGGLTEEEAAAALNISTRTVRRDWNLAKGWLLRELGHKIVNA